MKNNKLQDSSREELLKKEKTIKSLNYMLAGALLLLFSINIYNGITKGFSTISAFPIGLLPIFILNQKSLKDIKAELDSRGE